MIRLERESVFFSFSVSLCLSRLAFAKSGRMKLTCNVFFEVEAIGRGGDDDDDEVSESLP